MEAFLGGDALSVLWDEANVFAVERIGKHDGIQATTSSLTFPTRTMERAGSSLNDAGSRDFRQYRDRAEASLDRLRYFR